MNRDKIHYCTNCGKESEFMYMGDTNPMCHVWVCKECKWIDSIIESEKDADNQ